MSFYKAIRSKVHLQLMEHPNAYTLLSQIAYRARRTNEKCLKGLEMGEALIGDYKSIGLTRQMYRTALEKLINWHFVTIKTTNKGTIAKLLDSSIYDINVEDSNHQDNQSLTIKQPSSNHQATTNKKLRSKEVKNDKNTYIDKFNIFYVNYPKKKAKEDAKKAWMKIKPTNGLFEEIMTGLESAKKSTEWQKDSGQFIPYPATWLNKKRWEDEFMAKKTRHEEMMEEFKDAE